MAGSRGDVEPSGIVDLQYATETGQRPLLHATGCKETHADVFEGDHTASLHDVDRGLLC